MEQDMSLMDSALGVFGGNEAGALLVIFFVFFLDAFALPTLPEIFFAFGCMLNQSPLFGAGLLLTAVSAEIAGMLALYYVVEHIRVPARIKKIVDRYTSFLFMGDERLLLLNRIAPMIPFSGAFVSIMGWNLKKSVGCVILGCVLKYGSIALFSSYMYAYYSGSMAGTVTLIFVGAIIAVSFTLSYIVKRRKKGAADENC